MNAEHQAFMELIGIVVAIGSLMFLVSFVLRAIERDRVDNEVYDRIRKRD